MKPFTPLILMFFLAGCAPMAPQAPEVQALTPGHLDLQDNPSLQWPTEHWWRRYKDPQLDHLIDLALSANPSLQQAAARVRSAQAAARGARAVQWPQVNAAYHLTRERLSENYIYPPPLGGSYQSDTALTMQLDFDLDLWGKHKAQATAARQRADAAEAARQQARTVLVSAVAQGYFQLQDARAQADTIDAIVTKLEDALHITQDRYKNGLGTRVDVDQADSAVSSARVQLSQAHNNVQLLHHQLAALLGLSPTQLPALAAQTSIRPPQAALDELPLALLGRRADITAARLQAEAAGAEVSAAKADFLPNISLSAAAGYLSLGMDRLFRSGSADYSAGPVITLPVFHAGALNAQLEGRQAARDAAIAQYNQTILNAIREVADASSSIHALQDQIGHQDASLTSITSAYEVALERYRGGLGNFVQVLLAQSEVLKQAVQSTDLHARAYLLDVQLATALGGGYQQPGSTPTTAPLAPSPSLPHSRD